MITLYARQAELEAGTDAATEPQATEPQATEPQAARKPRQSTATRKSDRAAQDGAKASLHIAGGVPQHPADECVPEARSSRTPLRVTPG